MNRKIFIILFLLTSIQSYSQVKEYQNIHFLKFKIYQTEFDSGVPFAETCISDKNDDLVSNCIVTDFDGYAYFHINPNKYDIDLTYLKIRILQGYSNNDYGNPIIIPLNQIELLKAFKFDNDLRIILTDYEILNEKEYKEHRKKYGLMPDRKPTKAIDVE